MANKPIKISVLADVGKAVKEVTHFSDVVEEETHRVVTGLGDPKLTGGFGKLQEGFDVLDTRAMGFRDTITGVQDSMTGFQALLGQGSHASDTFGDKLLLLGMGVGDLASGFANFIIPMTAMATSLPKLTIAFRALNLTMLANPIFLVITLIVALVAIFVVAYKKSETFRKIVDGAFRGVLDVVSSVWGWIKGHWPLLFAILTGPVGLAIRWITGHWGQIITIVKALPDKIRSVYSGIGNLLKNAGIRLVRGFIDGILSQFSAVKNTLGSLTSKLTSWKGPAGRDRRLLAPAARLIMGGFRQTLESQYPGIRSSLAGFTTTLSDPAIASTNGAGAGARGHLEARLTVERTGDQLVDVLMEALADRISVRFGGSVQAALGR